jgi:hypothetical protein
MSVRHAVKAVVNVANAAAKAAASVVGTVVATAAKAMLHPATSMPRQPK